MVSINTTTNNAQILLLLIEITRLEAMVDEDKREKWEMQKTMDTMQEGSAH